MLLRCCAVDEENCFKEAGDSQCFEERVFYRLISGLHTSIHSQLAAHFYPDGAPNPLLWQQKVGLHPDRVKNLYFTYVLPTYTKRPRPRPHPHTYMSPARPSICS